VGTGGAEGPSAANSSASQPGELEPPSIPGVIALAPLDGSGLSTVYRGRHVRTGRGVAVKVLPTPFDRDSRAQFDRERARLGRLRHVPAVLQVDDIDLLPDGRPYLVSELCTDSVAELLQRGDRLSAQDVAAMGQELADALTMVHDVDIVHGGITPRNVLFRRSGQVALSDFGLALRRYYPGDPADNGEYTAPETLRDGALTQQSDLYGLGATLYSSLTGRPPFPVRAGEHPSERILRVMTQTAPTVDPDLVSPELSALLAELLATDPGERPADAAVVAARFAALPERPAHVADVSPARPHQVDEPAQPAPHDWGTNWSGLLDDVLYKAEPKNSPELPPSDDFEPPRTDGPELPETGDLVPPRTDGPELPRTDRLELPRTGPEPLPRHAPAARSATRPRRLAGVLAAVVAGLVLLAVLPNLSRQLGSPRHQPAARGVSPSPAGRSVGTSMRRPLPLQVAPTVSLVAAADHGQTVQLRWNGDSALEYAVIVAAPGAPVRVLLAHHAHSMQVSVSAGQRYCFLVQATNGKQVVQTPAHAIRGAVCRT
jgi:serine/threonine protein kinase